MKREGGQGGVAVTGERGPVETTNSGWGRWVGDGRSRSGWGNGGITSTTRQMIPR